MKLADLKPAPYNPRKISKESLAGLSASLHEFGDISGIVWNQRTGHLVAGHQRLDALKAEHGKALKLTQRNGGLLLKTPSDTFSIRVVDWPHTQEQAANIAANNPHIAGEFEQDALDKIIADLGETDYAELLKPLRIDELLSPKQVDEDEVPEPPEEPITKPGDLWALGEHRVLCGDAMLCKPDWAFAAMVADPPYSSGARQDGVTRHSTSVGTPKAKVGSVTRDNLTTGGYVTLIGRTLEAVNVETVYLFCDWRMWGHTANTLEAAGYPVRNMLVWDKKSVGMGFPWMNQHELVAFAKRHAAQPNRKGQGNVLQCARPGTRTHPTEKPVGVVGMLLNNTEDGDVYDPFLGSGTTLIAAEQLGRRCYGIEIEPKYVDVTVKRWEQLTGRKAKRKTERER